MSTQSPGRARMIEIVVVLVLMVSLYFWKVFAVRGVENRMGEQLAGLADNCSTAIGEQNAELLRLSGIPLAWAVRAELLRDNTGKVHDYLARFVKEAPVRRIIYADASGTIIAATDKKLEGTAAADLHGGPLLQIAEVRVVDREGKDVLLVAPVLGLDSRLGTLVVEYSREALERRTPQLPSASEDADEEAAGS